MFERELTAAKNDNILVLYHGPGCMDGFAAAYAMWEAFGDASNVQYVPIMYNEYYIHVAEVASDTDPCVIQTKDENGKILVSQIDQKTSVFIVDFSLKKAEIFALAARARQIIVFDHHKTAKDELSGEFPANVFITFDMDQSGCMITWRTMHTGIIPPMWMELVEDRDIHWPQKLQESKPFHESLRLYTRNFYFWSQLSSLDLPHMVKEGNSIIKYQEDVFAGYMKKAMVTERIIFCEAPYAMASELGNRLAIKYDMIVCIFYIKNIDMDIQCSFRSIGDKDTTVITKEYKGGGHKNASGCTMSFDLFQEFIARSDMIG